MSEHSGDILFSRSVTRVEVRCWSWGHTGPVALSCRSPCSFNLTAFSPFNLPATRPKIQPTNPAHQSAKRRLSSQCSPRA